MSKTINFANIVQAFSRGNQALSAIYTRGNHLIWSSTPSYKDQYMTIECVEAGDFKFDGTWMSNYASYDVTLYYSKNGGQWTEIHSTSPTTISAVVGDKFRFKGTNNAMSPMVGTAQTANTFRFTSGNFKAYGNVMSILFGDNFINATLTTGTNDYAFKDLFNQTGVPGGVLGDIIDIILPDVLTPHCFRAMFQNTAISSAPKLPATTLAEACYRYMFGNCDELISAPELPATTLVDYCYYGMFYYCTNLRYIKCSATSGINTNYSTYNWVVNVFSTGTFYKDSSTTWPTGNHGIPTTWTVKDIVTTVPDVPTITCNSNTVTITSDGADTIYYRVTGTSVWSEYTNPFSISATTTYEAYATNDFGDSAVCTPVTCQYVGFETQYLTFEVLTAGNIPWKSSKTISYSKDNGTTWISAPQNTVITADVGDIIIFKGNNTIYYGNSVTNSGFNTATSGSLDAYATYNVRGNIMSLIYGDDFIGKTTISTANAFKNLFATGRMVSTEHLVLPATTLAQGCYDGIFRQSKSIITPPSVLPATTLVQSCYANMFKSSTKLTSVPNISATTLAVRCYESMFSQCAALVSVPSNYLPITTLADYCYYNMFYQCSLLENAPILPATTLISNCYGYLFYKCPKLNYIKAMFTTTPSNSYTNSWVTGVASSGTFVKNINATWDVTGSNGVPSGWTIQTSAA